MGHGWRGMARDTSDPKSNPKRPLRFWNRFHRRWVSDGLTDSAAALTFYGLVSLVPLLLLGVGVAGAMLGERAAHGELEKQLAAVIGGEAAVFLEAIVRDARLMPQGNPFASLVAILALGYSGSHVLSKLRGTLNAVNRVEVNDPARPFLGRIFSRGLSALLILAFGILLVIGTVVKGFVGRFAERIDSPFLARWQVIRGYDALSSYLFLLLAFGLVLKILPRRRPKWRHAWAGAAVAALVVGSLRTGMEMYFRHSPLASAFGTGFAFLLFFFWLFLAIEAFLAGALLTDLLGHRAEERHARHDSDALPG